MERTSFRGDKEHERLTRKEQGTVRKCRWRKARNNKRPGKKLYNRAERIKGGGRRGGRGERGGREWGGY